MPLDEGRVESTHQDTGRPVTWTAVAVVGSGLVAAFSLPWDTPASIYDQVQRSDLFHPEWLVVGTLLVLPVVYAARASLIAAFLVIVLPGAQLLYVADSGLDTEARFGVARGVDHLWYVLAFAQVLLFAAAGVVAAHRGAVERRWVGYLAELTHDRPSDVRRNGPD
jgi:hypothetical protein